ncbi:hypothetical protein WQ57_23840 [Mesobacillus campisalis]|uniref:Fibronectin type-III domain-containing protein n=1 Tax=Mesobacillus campisalis TaxID=1408103 RepID=A0A0M2SH73_9BACI|nr:hypothetical protein [Mesobacillus campisalis]KKK33643.1 hypothetical protein WQ57_23840 [Mesobacillus campisalis]
MRKYGAFFLLSILLLVFGLTVQTETAQAAVGDRATPYSAWTKHKFTYHEYSWENPKVVELQLIGLYKGEEANYIIQEENYFNETPSYDEEWILMGFNLKYVSGPEETLNASDVIWSGKSFYTTSGQKVSPIDTASFSNILEGVGEYDVELYPGGQSEVWYGILVKKTVGFPLIRIASGVNPSTYVTQYKWFSTNPSYKEPVVVAAPTTPKAASNSYNSNKINWTAASGVSGYEIYRSTSSTGTFTKVGTTTGTSFVDPSLTTGKVYYYKVRAYKTGTTTSYSSFTSVVNAKPTLTTPGSPKAASSSYNSVKTSWSAVSGASGYEVYRSTSSTGTYTSVGSTTSTSFNNSGLTTNKAYYYKIRAYRMVGTSKVYSGYSAVVSAKPIPSVPANFSVSRASSTSIKSTWNAVSGASGYEVYRAPSSTGTYSLVKNTTTPAFTNTGLITGTYFYKVRAYRTVGTTKVYSNWTTVLSVKP